MKDAFSCICSLVALPVSTVSQLTSQDFLIGYFRGPDLFLFDGLRETSDIVFGIIDLIR